jgi:hypothetical protein
MNSTVDTRPAPTPPAANDHWREDGIGLSAAGGSCWSVRCGTEGMIVRPRMPGCPFHGTPGVPRFVAAVAPARPSDTSDPYAGRFAVRGFASAYAVDARARTSSDNRATVRANSSVGQLVSRFHSSPRLAFRVLIFSHVLVRFALVRFAPVRFALVDADHPRHGSAGGRRPPLRRRVRRLGSGSQDANSG